MGNRKQLEEANRRKYIISVAEKLILKNGTEKTTMDMIAKEASFSKTTIYKYFKSKDEIELLVRIKIKDKNVKFLKKHMNKHESGFDKLKAFAEAYYLFFKKNPSHLDIYLKHDYKGINRQNIRVEINEEFENSYTDDVNFMIDILDQGKEDNSFKADLDSLNTLNVFYLSLRALINQIVIIGRDNTIESQSHSIDNNYMIFLEIFLDGIKK